MGVTQVAGWPPFVYAVSIQVRMDLAVDEGTATAMATTSLMERVALLMHQAENASTEAEARAELMRLRQQCPHNGAEDYDNRYSSANSIAMMLGERGRYERGSHCPVCGTNLWNIRGPLDERGEREEPEIDFTYAQRENLPTQIWLDDEREVPDNKTWYRCYTVLQAIDRMRVGGVTYASLDHDLGRWANYGGDGYKLVDWMAENDCWPTDGIVCHSGNPVGRERIEGVIKRYGPY